ncbi:MAG: hypothetical protein NTV00_07835, partial [Methylococcales bacterium]|nr:hypothetical protein [Methylococcales bacterium]
MSNQNNTDSTDSKGIKTGWVITILVGIAVVVVGFYMFNFHKGLSVENEIWGTFGDYVGGILNPVIAGFAFYLIAETYKLQKRELEATRKLLQVSAEAQKDQIQLAALTSLLNSTLMRIGMLESEKISLLQGNMSEPTLPKASYESTPISHWQAPTPEDKTRYRFDDIQFEIK